MGRLLKYEFRKLFHTTSFYICGAITLVFAFINVYGMSLSQISTDEVPGAFSEIVNGLGAMFGSHSGAKLLVETSTQMQYTILFPIVIALFFCSDFADGTIKNIIGRGYSRESVYFAKTITCAIIGLIYYFGAMLVCTVYASCIWGFGTLSSNDIFAVIVQIVGLISYTTMCSLLSILFRKVSGAITIGIFTNIVFSALFLVIDLLALSKGSDLELTPLLLTSNISKAASTGLSTSTLISALLFCLGYGIVFTVLGYLSFRKKEI